VGTAVACGERLDPQRVAYPLMLGAGALVLAAVLGAVAALRASRVGNAAPSSG
jgi:hypothetical protein